MIAEPNLLSKKLEMFFLDFSHLKGYTKSITMGKSLG